MCIGPESLVTAKLAFLPSSASSNMVKEPVASIPTADANRSFKAVSSGPPIHTIPKPSQSKRYANCSKYGHLFSGRDLLEPACKITKGFFVSRFCAIHFPTLTFCFSAAKSKGLLSLTLIPRCSTTLHILSKMCVCPSHLSAG